MKEATRHIFLIKFELSDLKLVEIGTKIIKIGPEMPILEQFVEEVKISWFFGTFIYLKMPLLPPSEKSIVQHVPGQIWASKTPNLNSHIYRNHMHQGHAATTILRALLVDDDLPYCLMLQNRVKCAHE